MKIPIKFKIAALMILTVFLIMSGASIFLAKELKVPFEKETKKKGTLIATGLASNCREFLLTGDEVSLGTVVENVAKNNVLYAMVLSPDGKVLTHSGEVVRKGIKLTDPVTLQAMLGDDIQIIDTFDADSKEAVIDISCPVLVKDKKLGVIRVGLSKKEIDENIKALRGTIFGIAGFGLIAAVIISFIVARIMVRPVEDLTCAVKLLGEGKLDYRFRLKSNDEISQLAESFNVMADNLESVQTTLRRRVRDITMLLNASKELNFSVDDETIASIIMYTSKERVNASNAIIYLAGNDEANKLGLSLSSGYEDMVEVFIDVNDAVGKCLLKEKKILRIAELKEKCGERDDIARLEKFKCELVVPIIAKDSLKGVLLLGASKSENSYQPDDLEFISGLINMANVALENSYLHTLSITDGLTKAYLRRYFIFRVDEEIKRIKRYGGGISLLMCDLDFFKKVNDTFGHQAGDKILIEFVEIVKGISRTTDIIARYGGEEFAIIAAETSKEGAIIYAERIRNIVEKHLFNIGNAEINITCSIGISNYPLDVTGTQDLIKLADEALYQAKETGRNKVVVYEKK